LIVGV